MPDRPPWASGAGRGPGGVGTSGLCHGQCRGRLTGVGKVPGAGTRAAWWWQRAGSSVGGSTVAEATGSKWSCQLFSVHSGQPTLVPLSPCQPHTPSAMLTPLLPTQGSPPCRGSHGARCCGTAGTRVFRAPDPSPRPLSSRDATVPPPPQPLCTVPPPPASPARPCPAPGSQGLPGPACPAVALWAPARPLWSHPTEADLCPNVCP